MGGADSSWAAWIALRMVRGVGNVSGQALVRAFGDPREVFRASSHALECAGLRREAVASVRGFDRWKEVDEQLRRLDACRGRLVTWLDASYPENLRYIRDAPLMLFVRGDLQPEDRLAVAVVGSRGASAYGRRIAAQIASELARSGVVVVSGMARGIDAEAHWAALRSGGRTVAVLGCGIDVSYPSEHHRLQSKIAEQGAVVSEFLLGTQPEAENFPGRNRIISGMSLGTLVVEAAEKSGSLISAAYAVEQGREVFAVPGPVGPAARGVHNLLRQGATLVESAEDVLREIAPHVTRAAAPALPPLNEGESKVFAVLHDGGAHVDEIVARSGLSVAEALEALLQLELRGLVRQLPGKCFTREGGPDQLRLFQRQ